MPGLMRCPIQNLQAKGDALTWGNHNSEAYNVEETQKAIQYKKKY